ncbi:MAG: hypothetical protein IPL65_06335 [Lewinellaceae bacterium]|nr:hypothetical protein [Lewinellaceae bacterium]
MIKSLFKIALLLVAAILAYNYFFGTSEEKQQAREVFKKSGDAVGSAWNVLKAEKSKFDAGKYDKVMEQLGGAYKAIRERAQFVDDKVLKRLDDLERRKQDLQSQLDNIEQGDQELKNAPAPNSGKRALTKADQKKAEQTAAKQADQSRKKEQLLRQLDSLMRDTDKILKEVGEQ